MAQTAAKERENNWADTLRQAIKSSPLTVYAICKAASEPDRLMPQSMVSRFLKGASINLDTANRLGRVLGLELTQRKGHKT